MSSRLKFPKKFLWGASLSTHQVEGGNRNQWTEWEKANAASLAAQAPYHYSELDSWPDIEKLATLPANYISGRAVDHYSRYEEDFDIAADLGFNSLRVGIEWSRLEPEEGAWNVEAINHYRKYLRALKDRNLTPVVTLFHFTLPVWLAEQGGFARRKNIKYFVRYVEKVLEELGDDMRYIITINEPTVYASLGYLNGRWPPNIQNKRVFTSVVENLIIAHNRSAKIIRARSRRFQVSMAHQVSHVYAGDDARLSLQTARHMNYWKNHYIIKRTIRHSTFIGLNYYFSDRVYGYRVHNPNNQVNDLGWDMQPGDIRYVLEDLADRYSKPILITENGLADAKDEYRAWWLTETVTAIYKAMQRGVSVLGYLHWSLLDNIEWDQGRWPRFGLVEVDYRTMERRIRPSARVYGKIISKMRSER